MMREFLTLVANRGGVEPGAGLGGGAGLGAGQGPEAMRTVAALYVDGRGVYAGRPDVECWDEARDARLYRGPHPVVAHPPCARWGRWAGAAAGEDGGCFLAALEAVRRWGGVLEHPAASAAWRMFFLPRPPASGGWVPTGDGCWTCCVEQGHYGHRARKATWLLASGDVEPQELRWGPSVATIGPRPGRNPEREKRIGAVQRMGKAERERTPPAFAELLLDLARRA